MKRTKAKYLATGKLSRKEIREGVRPGKETVEQKRQRRVLPFAVPVAVATWLIVAWKIPTLDNPVRGKAEVAAPNVQNNL